MDAAVNYAFVAVLGLYIVYSVASNRGADALYARQLSKPLVALQTPLFLLAIVLAVREGAFSRDLVNPVYIGLGLLGGHAIFLVSLLITHRDIKDVFLYMFDYRDVAAYVIDHPYILTRFLSVAVAEEVIWRVAAQPLVIAWFRPEVWGLAAAAAGILLVAVAFSIVHHHFFRNTFMVSCEFLGFSLLLGGLYHWTGSLILVIVVHAVRNIEIAFFEYVGKVDELGDEGLASEEMERLYTAAGKP